MDMNNHRKIPREAMDEKYQFFHDNVTIILDLQRDKDICQSFLSKCFSFQFPPCLVHLHLPQKILDLLCLFFVLFVVCFDWSYNLVSSNCGRKLIFLDQQQPPPLLSFLSCAAKSLIILSA